MCVRIGKLLALALGLLRRGVPVVDHLGSEDGVEREASDEAVEEDLVVDFLEGGEDTGEGPDEVVEHLQHESVSVWSY